MQKKNKHPYRYLLLIPFTMLADMGLLLLGVFLDKRLFSHSIGLGHGSPAFILLAMLLASVLSLVMLLIIIVITIRRIRNK